MIPAIIMAAGRGERMRASQRRSDAGAAAVPKPLVPVAGVPLLERNIVALLAAGAREIAVTVPARTPEIERFVASRGREVARAAGAEIWAFREHWPLGTAGALAALRDRDEPVLVVHADNLTNIDLGDVVGSHLQSRAAMTVAVHEEPFTMPYGQVLVDADDRVAAHVEKPCWRVTIASGVYVVGPEAVGAVVPGESLPMHRLMTRMIERGASVRLHEHAALWIDVNDCAAVERAEAMVAAHPEVFARGLRVPSAEGVP